MKKIAIFAVMAMLSLSAFAQVKVSQNGTITTYEKGSTINISSKDAAEVYYDGVLITIPKGKRVVISQNKAGNLLIKGDNLNGVRVAGHTLKTEKPATYIVDPKNNIVVLASDEKVAAENVKAADKNNKKTANKNAQSTQSAGQETIVEVSFPEADQYVNEIVSEQAVQDVEENLSPSAPTSI